MRRLALALCTALFAFAPASAGAVTISLTPTAQFSPLASTFDVDLVISGLGAGGAPSISTFDLDVSFDPGVVSFTSALYGGQLDFILGSTQTTTPGAGAVNVFELSFDAISTLNANQAAAFTLVTLTFTPVAFGTSPLDLSIVTLGDAAGDPLPATTESASVEVPEPALVVLLGSALALVGLRRAEAA